MISTLLPPVFLIAVKLLAITFFAVLFLQSGLDKLINKTDNFNYLKSVFAKSFLNYFTSILFPLIILLEIGAGLFSAIGAIGILMGNTTFAQIGIVLSGFALLALFLGQRLAKDYAGAATLAAYFSVFLLGALLLM